MSDLPFTCPVCGEPLHLGAMAAFCRNNHAFDFAREGYLNLVTGKEARGKPQGDARSMVEARRSFLAAGHYDLMIRRLGELIAAELGPHHASPATILDLGCGEGHILCSLASSSSGPDVTWAGIDLSRDAIRAAARHCGHGVWFAIANVHHVPIADQSVDILLSIFAPIEGSEVSRVLRPDGRLIVAGPGREHLAELRRAVYRSPRAHDERLLPDDLRGMRKLWEERVRYELALSQPAITQLLAMTPYYWTASEETQQAVAAMTELTTPVDVLIACFVRGEV